MLPNAKMLSSWFPAAFAILVALGYPTASNSQEPGPPSGAAGPKLVVTPIKKSGEASSPTSPLPGNGHGLRLWPKRLTSGRGPKTPAAARHNANAKYSDPISVEVLDDEGRRVPGAKVTFSLPDDGTAASASFPDIKHEVSVDTDPDGIAVICQKGENCPKANRIGGTYDLAISADFFGVKGDAKIPQVNNPPPMVTRKRIIIAAVATAAVVVPLILLHSPHADISVISPAGPVGASRAAH